MSRFVYIAKALNGKTVKGEVDAENDSEVKIKLRAQQLIPQKIALKIDVPRAQGGGPSFGGKVKPKDLQIFTRQFAVLIGAGVPVMQSIEALMKGSSSPVLRKGLEGVAKDIGKGKRLGESMVRYPNLFDRLYVNLVKAGEEAGALDTVLERLAIYIEKSVALRGKVLGALWYPAIIIVVAAIVISAIMIFVIPSFMEMFKSSGTELPWLTQKIVEMSHFLSQQWYLILAGLFGAGFLFKHYRNSISGRKVTDQIFIQIPLFGDLILKSSIARLSRTLSTLLSSGVGIIEAFEIAARVAGNWVIEQAIRRAKDSIAKGKAIATPLAKERIIPSMVITMINIGEQTGALDTMLGKIADFYEDEVDNVVGALTSVIEPLLMVVLGGIIAVIVIAMYLPIFQMAGTMG